METFVTWTTPYFLYLFFLITVQIFSEDCVKNSVDGKFFFCKTVLNLKFVVEHEFWLAPLYEFVDKS